eukprot:569180-Pleurochrysis_carterae.AAC.1
MAPGCIRAVCAQAALVSQVSEICKSAAGVEPTKLELVLDARQTADEANGPDVESEAAENVFRRGGRGAGRR